MEILHTLAIAAAAVWGATGITKIFIVWSQMPDIMNWYVFYKTDDHDQANQWFRNPIYLITMIVGLVCTGVGFLLLGGLLVLNEGKRFFLPYSDCYLASIGAGLLRMDVGVIPEPWESWAEWSERKDVMAMMLKEMPTEDDNDDTPTRNPRDDESV